MSEIRATTISDAAGTGPIALTGQSASKGNVNYNSAMVIQNSLNVSSITDTATGRAVVNYTNSWDSGVYGSALGLMAGQSSESAVHENNSVAKTASALPVVTLIAGAYNDSNNVSVWNWGDLA